MAPQYDDIAETRAAKQLRTGRSIFLDPIPSDVLGFQLALKPFTQSVRLLAQLWKQLGHQGAIRVAGDGELEGYRLSASQMPFQCPREVERDL